MLGHDFEGAAGVLHSLYGRYSHNPDFYFAHSMEILRQTGISHHQSITSSVHFAESIQDIFAMARWYQVSPLPDSFNVQLDNECGFSYIAYKVFSRAVFSSASNG